MEKSEGNEQVQSVYTAQDFLKEYNELCEKRGYRITVNPAFVATNHGTFEVVVQYSVGKIGK